jgi:DNA/RNA-binding domain of Phe-tRNA-synthetase-like protein
MPDGPSCSFLVTPDCLRLGLRAGAIAFRGVHVGPSPPELLAAIAAEAAVVPQRFTTPAAIRAAPEVAAFQDLLRKVGANPRREQNSVERLLTYALKRGSLPGVNSLVDAYNLVSIRTGCSLGAHDLDRITLPVTLQVMAEAATFPPLGGTTEVVVNPGEYAYVDGQGRVLCRLDVIQADFSKVTTATTNALLIIEGTATHSPAVLQQAFVEAAEVIRRYCGGTAEVITLPPVESRHEGEVT